MDAEACFPEQFSRYNHDVADRKQRGRNVRGNHADNSSRAAATPRPIWLETLDRYMQDRDVPGSADYWSPRLDTASRDEITAIQDAKSRHRCHSYTRTAASIVAGLNGSLIADDIVRRRSDLLNGRWWKKPKWPPRTLPSIRRYHYR